MPPDGQSLQGKTLVVTGASSGVGLAIVRALGAQGAQVHAVSRRSIESTAQATCWPVDLADADAIDGFCKQLLARVDQLHGLIHCAGTLERRRIADNAAADADAHFQVNARAPMLLTTGLLAPLRAGRADVVFMNSSAALRPAAGVASYAMAKAALAAFAETLRAEENENGLRVLTVYLGRTATAMQQKLALQEQSVYRAERLIPPDDVAALLLAALALSERSELTELTLRPRFAPTRESRDNDKSGG